MLSKKGKYLIGLLMMLTWNLIIGQTTEFGLQTNAGVSKFHESRILGSFNSYSNELDPKFSESYDLGIFYRKTFKNRTFLTIELSYNWLKEKQIVRDGQLKDLEVISLDPYRTRWIDIGELKLARDKRSYEAISFPVSIGYKYKKVEILLGFGGTLVWSTKNSLHVERFINGEKEMETFNSNRKGYSFVQKLFRATLGYNISEQVRLNLGSYWAYENDEPELYYSQYMIGLEYILVNRRAR